MTVALIEDHMPELPYVTDHQHPPMIIDITPTLASKWLDRVPDLQRSIRNNHVDRLKKDMLNGDWRTDYTPYHFSKTGELLNGQHRCWAIVEANVVLENQSVVFGMDRNVYETLDQGSKRTFADTLKYYGYTNNFLLSALAYRYYNWEKYQSFRKGSERPTQNELLEIVRENSEELQNGIRVGAKVANHVKPLSNGVVALAYVLCNRIDEEDAKEFFDRLTDGQGLVDGEPIYALRNRWAVNAERKREKPLDYIQGAHLIKAWNFYRQGKEVQLLAWKSGGAKPEPFPQPE